MSVTGQRQRVYAAPQYTNREYVARIRRRQWIEACATPDYLADSEAEHVVTLEQTGVFVVLAATLALFVWDRWRYDVIAILTPIGHQSNVLVMGPGGYRFGDYWQMGLPLEALIVLVATPTILFVRPL